MGTPKATASDRMFALSVRANTIRPCTQKTPLPRPRVLYVAGIIQPSYKGCVIYKNLQHARGKTHHPIHPNAIKTSYTSQHQ